MGVAEIRRLRQLEEENGKLKQLVADLSLDRAMLQEVLRKKSLKPVRRRDLVRHLELAWEVSERRACRAMGFARSSHRYESQADRQEELRVKLREMAGARPSYGYRRLHVLLLRQGWHVNHKRVYRLYTEEGLVMRRKRPRRRVSAARRQKLPEPKTTNEGRSYMDHLIAPRKYHSPGIAREESTIPDPQ